MEAALRLANLHRAWRRVKSNRGAPGIDGSCIEDFPAYVGKRAAIIAGVSSKSYWRLARSPATQLGMTSDWLKAQGLVSIRDLWMQAHGYA